MNVSASLLMLAMIQTPSNDYAKVWEQVENAINARYYAKETRKDEMERLFRKYKPVASGAKDQHGFSKAVNDMIDEFRDSHFDFFTKEDQGYYAMQNLTNVQNQEEMPQFGAWFKKGVDGYTVQMVLDGSEAERAGLRKGDVVMQVNGQPFSPISALIDKVDKKVKLALRRGSTPLEKEVEVTNASAMGMFLKASRDSSKVIERNGRKIGYYHLWTMANDDFKNALAGAVYGRLKETDAIILDLRDGFGGRPEGFLDPFFRPEVELEWKMSAGGFKQLFGYQRPVVMLINEGSRSAKEVAALIFKKSGRGTLIGKNTAGHVLGTSPMRVNDWSYLEIPMVEVIADGERLEGRGVSPDVSVPLEFDANGKDLILERALETLQTVPTRSGR